MRVEGFADDRPGASNKTSENHSTRLHASKNTIETKTAFRTSFNRLLEALTPSSGHVTQNLEQDLT